MDDITVRQQIGKEEHQTLDTTIITYIFSLIKNYCRIVRWKICVFFSSVLVCVGFHMRFGRSSLQLSVWDGNSSPISNDDDDDIVDFCYFFSSLSLLASAWIQGNTLALKRISYKVYILKPQRQICSGRRTKTVDS